MGLLDKLLSAVRLNNDYDDDEEFFDDDLDTEEPDLNISPISNDAEEEKPKRRFFQKVSSQDSAEPEMKSVKTDFKSAKTASSSKVSPLLRTSLKNDMEVSVIRPTTKEHMREIADTLLTNCTVVLNVEGIDTPLAQRIIDFSSGTCYAVGGQIQMVSSSIFILTPANVEISGDIQDILGNGFPSIQSDF